MPELRARSTWQDKRLHSATCASARCLQGMRASTVPGPRWSFVLLASAVAMTAWRAWPMADAVHARAPADARAEADGDADERPRETPAGPVKTCLPFLAPILEHPNWQLRITRNDGTCYGPDFRGDFTIASTGDVTWTKPRWLERRLALSREQLALVRRLDQLSCEPRPELPRRLDQLSCVELSFGGRDPGWVWIGPKLGASDEYVGARISVESALGGAVAAMLNELVAEYRESRREVIGTMDLRLAITEPGLTYRVRVTGGRLTVERNRRRIVDEPLDPDLLIDLVDAALERRAAADPDVKGVLLMHGWSVPVMLRRDEPSPFDLIHLAIDRARDLDAEL